MGWENDLGSGLGLGLTCLWLGRVTPQPSSAQSHSNLSGKWVTLTVETDGVATSTTASWARFSRLAWSVVEARTIRTFTGKHWRNISWSTELSMAPTLSPSSCCMWRRSCVGFLSPSSSALNSCWNQHCSKVAVCCISCRFRMSYGVSSGGWRMRSRISIAYSGAMDITIWLYLVRCWVMPRVVNCASTCADQTCRLAGQNGGILTFTVPMLAASAWSATVSRWGHQCWLGVNLLNRLHVSSAKYQGNKSATPQRDAHGYKMDNVWLVTKWVK